MDVLHGIPRREYPLFPLFPLISTALYLFSLLVITWLVSGVWMHLSPCVSSVFYFGQRWARVSATMHTSKDPSGRRAVICGPVMSAGWISAPRGINLPFRSSFSYIMFFEFMYLIRPLGLLKLTLQFIWHMFTKVQAFFILCSAPCKNTYTPWTFHILKHSTYFYQDFMWCAFFFSPHWKISYI